MTVPTLGAVTGLIVLIVLAVGIGALLWWGVGLPRTRPRAGSRYRGSTEIDVHDRLQARRRRR